MESKESPVTSEADANDEHLDPEHKHILETHPAFINKQPTQDEIDNSPLLSGLQRLQYEDDGNTPEEVALAYKEDGNWHFKEKLYKKAVLAYTKGVKKKCSDNNLNAILFSNRAAANFYLENYGSAIKDSVEAIKLEPTKMKSFIRCAQSYLALERYQDAIEWAKKGLAVEAQNKQCKDILLESQKKLKVMERNKRKLDKQVKLKQSKRKMLVECIKNRTIKIDLTSARLIEDNAEDDLSEDDAVILSSIETVSHAKVRFVDESIKDLVKDGRLQWPVLFMYPEHQVSEVVEEFHEDSTFDAHLDVMFQERAPWDKSGIYKKELIEIYHETEDNDSIQSVPVDFTLGQVLSSGRISVKAGTPVFIALSQISPFKETFLANWKKI